MGNTSSLPGLGGGRTHVVRYGNPDGSWRGQRLEQTQIETMQTQSLENIEEEMDSSRQDEVLEPPVSHNGAQRGAVVPSDIMPTYEAARQTGRQALFTWE